MLALEECTDKNFRELARNFATMADIETERRRDEDDRLDAERVDAESLDNAPAEQDEVGAILSAVCRRWSASHCA